MWWFGMCRTHLGAASGWRYAALNLDPAEAAFGGSPLADVGVKPHTHVVDWGLMHKVSDRQLQAL